MSDLHEGLSCTHMRHLCRGLCYTYVVLVLTPAPVRHYLACLRLKYGHQLLHSLATSQTWITDAWF